MIRAESPSSLDAYARVPIAFDVREQLTVLTPAAGLGGLPLVEQPVAVPYRKDYDDDPDHRPTAWPERFDVSRWGMFAAYVGDVRCGGAVVVYGQPEIEMLEGRTDLAVLWDLRVAPEHRGQGVGASLFGAAESWARERGAAWLKVETQNVNLPACRFYARQGCTLGAVNRFAYPTLPDEVQLLWYKRLPPP